MDKPYRITLIAPLARLLMATIFIIAGVSKIFSWQQTAETMAMHHLPAIGLLLPLTVALELFGGLALLLGWNARAAASLLFFYMIPVTLTFHAFWSVPAAEMQTQLTNFLKNLGLMGGLLEVSLNGAGAYSRDALAARDNSTRGGGQSLKQTAA